MRRLLLLAAFGLAGCSLLPSHLWIGGSPLARNDRAQERLRAAQQAAVGGAQAAIHKADIALAAAPADSRPIAVARDFVEEAQGLLDQANGAPTLIQQTDWQQLVQGLLSENAAVRAAAERQRLADTAASTSLARRLASATANAQRANDRALGYAKESEGLADFARKLKLGFYGLIGLLVLGTVLSVLARFMPAFGVAAKLVNGVVAPGITYAAHRAEVGLQRVGEGMASLRKAGGDAEQLITQHFDGTIDADQKALIAAGAAAAGAPPPCSP